MHALFVHQNFPAQFGHIARRLVRERGWRCTFVSSKDGQNEPGVERVKYRPMGGATTATHYLARTFANAVAHAQGVHAACKERCVRPDLIVGHSGFGSTLFLADLWPGVPIVNYFEYFYHGHGVDLDFRPEFPPKEENILRARARNAMILLDLETCAAGYSPTHWQRSLFPADRQRKIEVIFDGIDRELWCRREVPRRIGEREIAPATRVVTYAARGFESMRGFDIFMRTAARIAEQRPDVIFVVVGSDRICYGGDAQHIRHKTFREHVLASGDYDLSRFVFTGLVPPAELARLFSLSDLHLYLTVPFVLSWSLLNALSCGCTVLASDTAPVREVIRHEENGLLADFFDVEGLTREALRVLDDPAAFRGRLGRSGEELIERRYALPVVLPKLVEFYERCAGSGSGANLGR